MVKNLKTKHNPTLPNPTPINKHEQISKSLTNRLKSKRCRWPTPLMDPHDNKINIRFQYWDIYFREY